MADHIAQIKERLNIVDVISGYMKVQKAGVNFKARCPFHSEKTPSFVISPERQIWHCFGCGKGGDMFGFVKELDGVEFPEALRTLALRAGVELGDYNPREHDERARLYDICELACKFFEKQLNASTYGKQASEYLTQRGVLSDTVKTFRLGFAPQDWHALGAFLTNCGYKEKEVIDAGLSIKNENGRVYDRFRSRIIFPIADINRRIVGFTGRVFSAKGGPASDGEPVSAKYINTPQTTIYDKSRILYGLSLARTSIRQADKCLLVEGNMDALMSYQGGVKNVVASSGTALTHEHLQLIDRYTKNIDFCFDTDQAGATATRRGVGLALAQGFTVRAIPMTDNECKDPADYVAKHGSKWEEFVKSAKPIVEFYFEKARTLYTPSDVESKKALLASVGPLIKRMTSRIEQTHWISYVASFLRVMESDVAADINAIKDDLDTYEDRSQTPQKPVEEKHERKSVVHELDGIHEALLATVFRNAVLFRGELASSDEAVIKPRVVEILRHIGKLSDERLSAGAGAYISDIQSLMNMQPSECLAVEIAYMRSQELMKDFDDETLKAEYSGLVRRLQMENIIKEQGRLTFDISEAEAANDNERVSALSTKMGTLLQARAKLEKA